MTRGSRDPFDVTVEADGDLVVLDVGLGAVVRVNALRGDSTIVCDTDTGSMRETRIRSGGCPQTSRRVVLGLEILTLVAWH